MVLRIIKLEPRILFDASAAGVIADAAQTDGSNDSGQAESTESTSDTHDSQDTENDVSVASGNTAPESGQEVNVLLISSKVAHAQELANAVAEEVVVLIYDADNATLADIYAQLENALDGKKADSIGLATPSESSIFHLTGDIYVTAESLTNNTELQSFWNGIGSLLHENGRLDLIGGNIASESTSVVSALEAALGADVAASTDATGNKDGENWHLEVGDIDALLYFNTSQLAEWTGSLDYTNVTDGPQAAIQDGDVSILLIASNVKDAQQLADAAVDGVITIVYDYENTTLEQLQQLISDALDGRQADNINFTTEGQSGFFYLLDGIYVTAETLQENSELATFWQNISDHMADNSKLDLLGCFVGGLNGRDYGLISVLNSILDIDGKDIHVAASTDDTGNLEGGNWILEVGNIDAASYFRADDLALWMNKLATFTVTSTGNSGSGTLRDAIEDANSSSGIDTINFSISASSIITLSADINSDGPIRLRGDSAPGYSLWSNMITIRGPANDNIIFFDGTGNEIVGLQFEKPSFTLGSSDTQVMLSVRENASATFTNNRFFNAQSAISVNNGTSVTALGNRFGTNLAGTSSNNNLGAGLNIDPGGSVTVGGTNPGDGNLFAGVANGILINGGAVNIYGNYFGTNAAGTADITNVPIFTESAIVINNSASISTINIGGTSPGQGNLISGYDRGIITGTGSGGTINISGNLIGTNVDGTAALGNTVVGIQINRASTVNIGGTTEAHRNIISGNGTGINIENASSLTIRGNYIGTDINGTAAIPNTIGINLDTSGSFTIGGTTASARNVISGNVEGIVISNGTGHNIYGNYIGVAADGVTSLPNTSNGVRISGGSGTSVGGISSGQPNIIAHNGGAGVLVDGSSGNDIRQNSIYENGGLGIDLVSGGNGGQVAPGLTGASYNSGTDEFSITGSFTGVSGQSYALEFFANEVNDGEGKIYLGVLTLVSSGTNSFTFTMSGPPPPTAVAYTATATRTSLNNTSEFSTPLTFSPPSVDLNGPGGGIDETRTFTEDGGPVAIAPNATITDSDSTDLESMTVTLTNRPDGADESLSVTLTGGITGSYDSGTGVLALTGTSSVANYQTVLRSITYENLSQDPDTTDRIITVVVDDGVASSASTTSTMEVVPVNDPPVLANGSSITYTENDPATAINANITVSDVDDTNIESAVVAISNNFASGEDVLGFTTQNGITGSYNAATGELTLTGSATLANYQTALRSITYSNSSEDPSALSRTITYTINDGDADSNSVDSTVNINSENDIPVALNDAIEVAEGGTATTLVGGDDSVLDNDTDEDTSDVLTVNDEDGVTPGIQIVSGPSFGTLTINPDGTFSYTHDGSENFTDSFVYRATDGTDVSNNATVNITINEVNDNNPVAVNDAIEVAEGGTATTLVGGDDSVLDNDTDEDTSDTLSVNDEDGVTPGIQIVSGPSFGTLTINSDGTFSYTHDGSENFSDSFVYRATDGTNVSSNATVDITITEVNDNTPVALNDSIQVAEGGTATTLVGGASSVLANDTDDDTSDVLTVNDEDGGTAGIQIVSGPSFGTLTINADGTFSYTHDGSENFSDSFVYRATDGTNISGNATVDITITEVNDNTPVALNDSIQVAEGGTATTLVGGAGSVLANDTDDDTSDVLTVNDEDGGTAGIQIVSGPSFGTLTINADGTFSYTHDGSENFSDSFVYRATDGSNISNNATVDITITEVNDNTPVALNDSIQVAEGGTATTLVGGAGSVLANDTDDDTSDVLTVNDEDGGTAGIQIVSGPSFGTLTINADGTFSYTHDGSENFSDSFVYRATDGTNISANATVDITITEVNDNTPVALNDSIQVAEGGTATTLVGGAGSVLANDTDDDTSDVLTVNDEDGGTAGIQIVSGPSFGTLTINADGTFSYTHDGSENFTDSFVYRATDGTNISNNATVDITVTPVSDNTPVALNDSIQVAEGGTATTLVGGAGSVLANDTDDDTSDILTVNDEDGGTAGIQIVSGPSFGTLTINADGTFSYSHDGSENFTDSFVYRATDGSNISNNATVDITITEVNDNNPVALNDSIQVAEGGTATTLVGGAGSVLANDSDDDISDVLTVNDEDGGTAGIQIVSGPSFGTLTINSDGTFSYTHDGSENFSDSFVYRATDGTNTSSNATVDITITGVNDNTPVALNDNIQVAEGGTATTLVGGAGSVLANDTDDDTSDVLTVNDEDGGTAGIQIVSGPSFGTLTINADGTFSYTHDGSENFSDSFVYRATDGTNISNNATVDITITEVNDNTPVALNDSIQVAEGGTASTLVGGAGSVLANDSDDDTSDILTVNDEDGGTAGIQIVSGPSFGTLTINADGTFSYTHDGSENFSDSFVYRATDGSNISNNATVDITISEVNDNTPVALNDNIQVAEGGTATTLVGGAGSVLANDSDDDISDVLTVNDEDGGTAGIQIVSGPSFGTLTINADGTFSYTHDGSENFTDSFVYRATDGSNISNNATVDITVTPVSDNTPVALNDSIQVAEGGTATTLVGGAGSVLANDTDDDTSDVLTVNDENGGTAGIQIVSGPSFGTLTINADGTFSYTHDGSENFSDSFIYRATDGTNISNNATVDITITEVNDNNPVAINDSIQVAEGGTATTLVGGAGSVLANDSDDDISDVLTVNDEDGGTAGIQIVSGPSFGTLTINSDGTFSYTHDGSENFSDSFVYRATDGTNTSSNATVDITITEINDNTPVALNDSIQVAEGGTATTLVGGAGSVLANDSDEDTSDVLTVNDEDGGTAGIQIVSGPSFGTLTINADGTFSYTHDGSENFTDSFVYRATDGTNVSNNATVNITINEVNDNAPVALNDAIEVAEGGTATTLVGGDDSVLDNDTDEDTSTTLSINDEDGGTPGIQIVSGPSNGTLTINSDGTFSYTHDGSENFTDSFVYRTTDGSNVSNNATVNITISEVNDNAPVALGDAIEVAEGGTATTLIGGNDSVLDNDTDEDISDTLSVNDEDGGTPGIQIVSGPSNGVLTINSDGTFSYTHDGSETGSDSFVYRATDGSLPGNNATVTITITAVNDAFVEVVNNPINVDEGGTEIIDENNLEYSDVDNTPDQLVYTITDDVDNGTLQRNGSDLSVGDTFTQQDLNDGIITYVHDGSETTSDSFNYSLSDGTTILNDTLNITINPVNDPPVLATNPLTVIEGGSEQVTVTELNATDVDNTNSELTYLIDSNVINGRLLLNGVEIGIGDSFTQQDIIDGNLVYEHNDSETTSDSFNFTLFDGDADVPGTLLINITPVNDPPDLYTDTITTDSTGQAPITDSDLQAVDIDTTPDNLVFTITDDVDNGQLYLDNTPIGLGDSFTQEDINNDRIRYVHNGSNTPGDSFDFTLTDGDSTIDGTLPIKNALFIPESNNGPEFRQPVLEVNSFQFDQSRTQLGIYAGSLGVGRGIPYGFMNLQNVNQLTSFGGNLGYAQLVRMGDETASFRIIDSQPVLSHQDRDIGFGTLTNPIQDAYHPFGVASRNIDIQDYIRDLSNSGKLSSSIGDEELPQEATTLVQDLLSWIQRIR